MRRVTKKTRGSSYEKLAISLPHDLAQAAREEAVAQGAGSLSAFVAKAVAEKLERDQLQAALDEVFREHPITDEERDWADKFLLD